MTAADFSRYSITVPTDSRLAQSGQVLSGFYEVNPAKAGLVDNLPTLADNYGNETEHWNGYRHHRQRASPQRFYGSGRDQHRAPVD